jgi:hypothetical protein
VQGLLRTGGVFTSIGHESTRTSTTSLLSPSFFDTALHEKVEKRKETRGETALETGELHMLFRYEIISIRTWRLKKKV